MDCGLQPKVDPKADTGLPWVNSRIENNPTAVAAFFRQMIQSKKHQFRAPQPAGAQSLIGSINQETKTEEAQAP
jgi:hypothetical protein